MRKAERLMVAQAWDHDRPAFGRREVVKEEMAARLTRVVHVLDFVVEEAVSVLRRPHPWTHAKYRPPSFADSDAEQIQFWAPLEA